MNIENEKFLDSNQIHEFVFKQISEGVVVHDDQGKIVHFNDSALKILGLQRDQLIGKDPFDSSWKTYHLDGSLMKNEEHPAHQTLLTGVSCENFTMGVRQPSGDLRWILINSTPILTFDRTKVQNVVVTFLDITKQINQQNESLQAVKYSTLNEISSGILHDLNNPLSVINGHLQQLSRLIKDDNLDRIQIVEKIDSMKKMSNRMLSMMTSFKNYARDGRLDKPELMNIHDLCEEAIEVCSFQLKKNQNTVKIEISDSFNITCRSTILLQVIANLLVNAGEATREAKDKTIILKAHIDNDCFRISIIDHGIGITADRQENIFQAFYSTKKLSQGSGIGLFYSKKLVESQGGQLTFSSTTDRTEFRIQMPLFLN